LLRNDSTPPGLPSAAGPFLRRGVQDSKEAPGLCSFLLGWQELRIGAWRVCENVPNESTASAEWRRGCRRPSTKRIWRRSG